VIAMNRPKINDLAQEILGDVPGSQRYLSNYHKARLQFEQTLSEDDRKIYNALAKKWMEKKLPKNMQKRYVHGDDSSRLKSTYSSHYCSMLKKHGIKAIKDFTSTAYKQFGMRLVILAAFVDDDGDPAISLWA